LPALFLIFTEYAGYFDHYALLWVVVIGYIISGELDFKDAWGAAGVALPHGDVMKITVELSDRLREEQTAHLARLPEIVPRLRHYVSILRYSHGCAELGEIDVDFIDFLVGAIAGAARR